MEIITPKDSVGTLMELCQGRRGDFVDMQFLTETRTTLIYELPLALVSPLQPLHAAFHMRPFTCSSTVVDLCCTFQTCGWPICPTVCLSVTSYLLAGAFGHGLNYFVVAMVT